MCLSIFRKPSAGLRSANVIVTSSQMRLFRLAVPDGHRRDPDYVAEITLPGTATKVVFTIDNLVPLLESVGFQVTPLRVL